MDDKTLVSLLQKKITSATDYQGSILAKSRLAAEKYYLGEPFGNEVDGESKAVSRDVAEAVDAMLPSLIKMFAASSDVVRFDPWSPEGEQAASQATDYVNYLWNVKNQGFAIFYSWFKTALIKKRGVVKVWWEQKETVKKERYYGLSESEIELLRANPQITVIDEEDGYFTVSIAQDDGCIRIATVPPDEFLIDQFAIDDETASFTAHRLQRTLSDLKEAGYSNLDELAAAMDLMSDERTHRFSQDGTLVYDDAEGEDKSMRLVWVTECYLKVDHDDDGIAEMRRVTLGGDGSDSVILENEEVEHHPFATLCPFPAPDAFWGESVYDKVRDIQEQSSVLLRQILNNLYHQNMPAYGVLENHINIEDMLTRSFGKVVRMSRPDAVFPLPSNQLGSGPYNMLSLLAVAREQRTGVRRLATGPGADTLQNAYTETLGGAQMVGEASAERLELVARIFAETGVSRAMKLILHMIMKYDQKPKILKLRGKWTPIDPREWTEGMDLTINVGLGTGNQQSHAATMMALLAMDEKIIAMQGGVQGPILTIQNVYNKFRKLAAASGLKDIEQFYTDPSTLPPAPPQAPPADPVMIAVQGKIEADQAKIQADAQADAAKLNLAREQAARDAAMKQEGNIVDLQMEREKAALGAQTDLQKAAIQADASLKKAQIDAVAKERVAMIAAGANPPPVDWEQEPPEENQMQTTIQAIAASLEQMASSIAANTEQIQLVQTVLMAPRNVIRDKQKRLVGVQIEGMPMRSVTHDETGLVSGLN